MRRRRVVGEGSSSASLSPARLLKEAPDRVDTILHERAHECDALNARGPDPRRRRVLAGLLAAAATWLVEPVLGQELDVAIRVAHTMAGTAGTYGFARLSDAARELELAVEAGEPSRIPTLLDDLQRLAGEL